MPRKNDLRANAFPDKTPQADVFRLLNSV